MSTMSGKSKSAQRVPCAGGVRQSVTLPAPLAVEVRRVAREQRLTLSRAVVSLVARGVQAEQMEKGTLEVAYSRFMNKKSPARKESAGKDLIRAVFGKDAIADDPLR